MPNVSNNTIFAAGFTAFVFAVAILQIPFQYALSNGMLQGAQTISASAYMSATGYRGQHGTQYSFNCPANLAQSSIWGTDTYTDDSPICSAAVHAGAINRSTGGAVTIEIRPGAQSYTASTQNGVASNSWGAWVGSYVFVKGGSSAGASIPSVPATLAQPSMNSPQCSSDGTSVTLSWNTVSGADVYAVRVDDPTNNTSNCLDGWYCGGTQLDLLNDEVVTKYVQKAIVPGRAYEWWVHAKQAGTWEGVSGYTKQSFTCNAPAPSPIPTCTLTASKNTVDVGGTVTLSWTTTDSTSRTLEPGAGGSGSYTGLSSSGSKTVSPVGPGGWQVPYTLTVTGPGGTATCSKTISINAAPVVVTPVPTCTLTASANSVEVGSPITLNWTSTNSTSNTITPGVNGSGSITGLSTSGSRTVYPAGPAGWQAVYTMTVTGAGGTATCSKTVSITAAPSCPIHSSGTYPNCTCNSGFTGNGQTGANLVCTAIVTPQCTPASPSTQTQTVNCATGQTGSITQTRTSVCAVGATSPSWTSWTTTSNTCQTVVTQTCPAGTTGTYPNCVAAPTALAQPGMNSPQCSSDGTSAYLSWSAVSGAEEYALRVDDPTNNSASCLDGWYCNGAGDYLADTLTARSINKTVVPGRTYEWWVHAKNVGTWSNVSGYTKQSFTCDAPIVTNQCAPTSPSTQTQTVNCPTGQTGSITQTRTSICAPGATSPTWTNWTTTANTCQATVIPMPSCTIAASPSVLPYGGGYVTLTTTAQNASHGNINGSYASSLNGTKSQYVAVSNTQTMYVYNANYQSTTCSTRVTVCARGEAVENGACVSTGSVLAKRVGADLTTTSAPATTVALDGGTAISTNPKTFTGVTAGTHILTVTDVAGKTETAGMCAFLSGSAECTVSTFPQTMTCDGSTCSLGVTVATNANATTKVVVKYETSEAPVTCQGIGCTTPTIDMCLNIAGTQAAVPAGYNRDAAGNCFAVVTVPVPTDMCTNISGTQSTVPTGYTRDLAGNCIATNTSTTLAEPKMDDTVTCNTDGTRATLDWDSVSGADVYALRIDDTSNNNTSCTDGWHCNQGDDLINDSITATGYTATVKPGVQYEWWVHAKKANTWNGISTMTRQKFTCTLKRTNASMEVGMNDLLILGNAMASGVFTAPVYAPNSQVIPLSTAQNHVAALKGKGITTWREIVPVHAFATAAAHPAMAAVVREFKANGMTLMLANGWPLNSSWGNPGTSCFMPASGTAGDREWKDRADEIAKAMVDFLVYLKDEQRSGVGSTYVRNNMIIDPWNEFDGIGSGSGGADGQTCATPYTGTPERAAVLYKAIVNELSRRNVDVSEVTAPSTAGTMLSDTYMSRYYAAGGGGRPNIHIYNRFTVQEYINTYKERLTGVSRQGAIIGEIGVCDASMSKSDRVAYYQRMLSNSQLNSEASMILFWRLFPDFPGQSCNSNITTGSAAQTPTASYNELGQAIFDAIKP